MHIPKKLFSKADNNSSPGNGKNSLPLMLSQNAAYYVFENSEAHKKAYLSYLKKLKLYPLAAQKLFELECETIRSGNKRELLLPEYTKLWLFPLDKPYFSDGSGDEQMLLRTHGLAISELCKLMDEAEWHFWNSHEKELPAGVLAELYKWRLKGTGGEFGIQYFEMLSQKTGVPMAILARICSQEGAHLSRYKWG